MTVCKACNTPLDEEELIRKDPVTNELEELCTRCLNSALGIIGEEDTLLDRLLEKEDEGSIIVDWEDL